MPDFRSQVWNELNSIDPDYAKRGEFNQTEWAVKLSKDGDFTKELYAWLKRTNSSVLNDVENVQDFYKKILAGSAGKKPSEEQLKFNSFYDLYKPLLKDKSEEDIVKAFRTGKIGSLDTTVNSDYEGPKKQTEVPDTNKPYSFIPMNLDPTSSKFLQQDVETDEITGFYNKNKDKADEEISGNIDGVKGLTHSRAINTTNREEVKNYLKILAENGTSNQQLDRLSHGNSDFTYAFPDENKINAINPETKGYQSNIISTTGSDGEWIGGGFLSNYTKSQDGTPFSPEIVNSWWNEKTMAPIKQSVPRFFTGGYAAGDYQEEYEALLEAYNEATLHFNKVQKKEGWYEKGAQDVGGAVYDEALYQYAQTSEKLMKFFFEQTNPGRLVKRKIEVAAEEKTKLQGELKIAQIETDKRTSQYLFENVGSDKKQSVELSKQDSLNVKQNIITIEENNTLEVADALTDILYVTYGAGHAFGINLDKCFDEVQKSNMSKLDANGKPIYNESGKVMKGPNYFKPDLSKFVN